MLRKRNLISICPLNNNEDYRDGEIYKVRFFGKKYQSKLIQKGTAEECEKRVEYLTNYLLEQGKKKQASKSTNKQNEKEVEKQNETKNNNTVSIKLTIINIIIKVYSPLQYI